MTLWILFCRMSKDIDTLFTFYAKDRHHAELKAEELLDWYGYERIELKAYPGGFRMAFTHIPGTVLENNASKRFAKWYTSSSRQRMGCGIGHLRGLYRDFCFQHPEIDIEWRPIRPADETCKRFGPKNAAESVQ